MSQSIVILFTKSDQDLITWVNMLIEHEMRPATWIQATLLSERLSLKLDAGGIYMPVHRPGQIADHTSRPILQMFGDDTEAEAPVDSREDPVPSHRCQDVRVGSKIKIRVTRRSIEKIVINLKARRKKVGPYVKAALRKHIRRLSSGPNQPPDPLQIVDLFTLYEDQITDETAPVTNRGKSASEPNRGEAHDSGQKSDDIQQVLSKDICENTPDHSSSPSRKKNPLLQYIG